MFHFISSSISWDFLGTVNFVFASLQYLEKLNWTEKWRRKDHFTALLCRKKTMRNSQILSAFTTYRVENPRACPFLRLLSINSTAVDKLEKSSKPTLTVLGNEQKKILQQNKLFDTWVGQILYIWVNKQGQWQVHIKESGGSLNFKLWP
jgi:hypothetical protein